MPSRCSVFGCKNNNYNTNFGFHSFPNDEKIKKKWVEFCKRGDWIKKVPPTSRICSSHFVESDFDSNICAMQSVNFKFKRYLKPGSHPTVNTAAELASGRQPLRAFQRRCSKGKQTEEKASQKVSQRVLLTKLQPQDNLETIPVLIVAATGASKISEQQQQQACGYSGFLKQQQTQCEANRIAWATFSGAVATTGQQQTSCEANRLTMAASGVAGTLEQQQARNEVCRLATAAPRAAETPVQQHQVSVEADRNALTTMYSANKTSTVMSLSDFLTQQQAWHGANLIVPAAINGTVVITGQQQTSYEANQLSAAASGAAETLEQPQVRQNATAVAETWNRSMKAMTDTVRYHYLEGGEGMYESRMKKNFCIQSVLHPFK